MNTKRLIISAFTCSLLYFPAMLVAGQPLDQDSVVDAAKKAQAEKKTGIKPKMVIDNDNLSTLTGTVNVVGQEPPAPADPSKTGAQDKTKEKTDVKDEKYWRAQFAEANKKLDNDSHELDILQREYNLNIPLQ